MNVEFKFKPSEEVILNCTNGNKYRAKIHKCIYDSNGISYEIITFNRDKNKHKPQMTIVLESFLTKEES